MIYLDNCSTTKMRDEVIEVISRSLKSDFANPSSLHDLGFKIEKKINLVREDIAKFIGANRDDIYFTSGGTESNNIAIKSVIKKMRRKGKHLITSSIEHPSVLEVFKELEKEGYEVDYLSVDKLGSISLKEFKELYRHEETILVSIMHVNNEIGTIQPIMDIAKLLKGKSTIFHVDGVQAFGKLDFKLTDTNIDLYSFSGHKVYGPKGIGGLYINPKLGLRSVIYGGGQEKGFRSGTENTHSIIGLGKAVEIMFNKKEEEKSHIIKLNKYLRKRLKEIDDILINNSYELSSPYIISLSINNIRGEVLLHYLENEEIYVSTSSACSSNGTKKSHVLEAINLPTSYLEGTIRICLSYEITYEDIDRFIEVLKKSVKDIREIIMR